jgi:hypothetical protein
MVMMALSAGGFARGDLQRVEAAPGNAEHADLAGAPALPRDPGDDFQRVVLLLLRVFIEHQAVAESPLPRMSTRIEA